MLELTLVRHGQTANNAARLIQGTLDVPLSEQGFRQARALGAALSVRKFDRVISSPLARAMKTAEAIAHHHDLVVCTDQLLCERSFGRFQGGPQQDYARALADSGQPRWMYRPPEGETIPEVWLRVEVFLSALRLRGDQRVVIAAHEGINKCLILMLLGRPIEDWTSIKQDNCCINDFSFHADGSLRHFELNQTAHLESV